jgi:hypothetical protein
LKDKIVQLQNENIQLHLTTSSRDDSTGSLLATSEGPALQAAQARCVQLEEQLKAAQDSLLQLQQNYDDSRIAFHAAQADASSARSERDKLQADLNAVQIQNERLSLSSAKLAAAAAQSPTATSFYKAQASPVVPDPTVEPVAASSMDADAIPRRSSQDKQINETGMSLLEKGQLKLHAKRSVATPPMSPQISALPPHTPVSNTRASFHASASDSISLHTLDTAEDALDGIRALLAGCVPGSSEQLSHAELYASVRSLCSEVSVLRRVVTNTDRPALSAGSNAASPRTPRSNNAFMPFMPKAAAIPSDTAVPERLRITEVTFLSLLSVVFVALTSCRKKTLC